jgi:hypothetical protein
MEKREAILARLVEIAAALPGIKTAVRNQDEVSERARPAIAIFDADETADERAEERGHSGRAPNIIEMSPETLILLGGAPEAVGTALNEMRAKFIKAVLTDAQLAALTGPNGRVRYVGCGTHLGHGRSMEASMSVQFAFAYVLRPDQL